MSVSSGSDVTIPIQDSPPPPPSPYANSNHRKNNMEMESQSHSQTQSTEQKKQSESEQQQQQQKSKSSPNSRKSSHTEIPMNDYSSNHNSIHSNHSVVNEAINSELVNHNVLDTIPHKPQTELGPYENFDQYFISVNEHKKFLRRGEKLSVTKDKRKKSNKWKKGVCWGFGGFLVISIVTIAILAALGIVPHKPSSSGGGSFSQVGMTTTPESIESSTTDFPSLSSTSTELVDDGFGFGMFSSTTLKPITDNYVRSAAEIEIKFVDEEFDSDLLNPESSKFKTLAKEIEQEMKNVLENQGNVQTAFVRVTGFSEGSIITKLRISWTNDVQELSDIQRLFSTLRNLGDHSIAPGTTVYPLFNFCKPPLKNGCSDSCRFDYEALDFVCFCHDEGALLAEDKKTCTIPTVLSTSTGSPPIEVITDIFDTESSTVAPSTSTTTTTTTIAPIPSESSTTTTTIAPILSESPTTTKTTAPIQSEATSTTTTLAPTITETLTTTTTTPTTTSASTTTTEPTTTTTTQTPTTTSTTTTTTPPPTITPEPTTTTITTSTTTTTAPEIPIPEEIQEITTIIPEAEESIQTNPTVSAIMEPDVESRIVQQPPPEENSGSLTSGESEQSQSQSAEEGISIHSNNSSSSVEPEVTQASPRPKESRAYKENSEEIMEESGTDVPPVVIIPIPNPPTRGPIQINSDEIMAVGDDNMTLVNAILSSKITTTPNPIGGSMEQASREIEAVEPSSVEVFNEQNGSGGQSLERIQEAADTNPVVIEELTTTPSPIFHSLANDTLVNELTPGLTTASPIEVETEFIPIKNNGPSFQSQENEETGSDSQNSDNSASAEHEHHDNNNPTTTLKNPAFEEFPIPINGTQSGETSSNEEIDGRESGASHAVSVENDVKK